METTQAEGSNGDVGAATDSFHDYGPLELTADNLTLVRSIAHQIEKEKIGNQRPTYSALLSNSLQKMPEKLAKTVRVRIVRAFATNSRKYAIRFLRDGPGTVFDSAYKMLSVTEDADFTELSKGLAEDLADAHGQGAPGGLFFVSQALIDNHKALILIKADKQDGIVEQENDGERTYTLVEKLFLSSGSIVHKVAILVKRGDGDGQSSIQAMLFDGSLRKEEDLKPSQYFVEGFLAAEIARQGRRETLKFYGELTKAINAVDATLEQKVELSRLRDAFMSGPASTFTLSEYVDNHVPEPLQEQVEELLRAAGVHDEVILKDTQDLKRKLEFSGFAFDNGVILKVPPGTRQSDFKVSQQDGQVTIVTKAQNVTVLK